MTSLRACLKTRPVRGSGLHEREVSVVSGCVFKQAPRQHWRAWAGLLALVGVTLAASAQQSQRPAVSIGRQTRSSPSGSGASTQEANRPGTPDYNASFKLIADRNIFNANRYQGGRSVGPQVRVDTVSLLGTMNYEKGQFAFFDGTSPDFTKTLKPDETIAGFKVLDVASSGVKLQEVTSTADANTNTATLSTNTVELRVGYQLRRENGGPWQVVLITESSSPMDQGQAGGDSGFQGDRGGGRNFSFGRAPGNQVTGGYSGRKSDFGNNQDNGNGSRRNRDSGNNGSGTTFTPGNGSSRTTGNGTGADPNTVLQRLMQLRQQELGTPNP